jgi:hypothetical protein
MMPLQGIEFHVTLSPERALALAQGIALRIKLRDQTKALKGRKQLIKSLSRRLCPMGFHWSPLHGYGYYSGLETLAFFNY